MPSPPIDAALDQLYAADPSDFVELRKQLASGLRSAGDAAAAKELATARRPSTSAWALNQLARRQPGLVDAFLERSSDLVAEQTRAASGDGLRPAIRAHREALDEATGAALAILGSRANDGFRNEIVATLRTAGTDVAVGRQLRLGRLVRESAPSSGFPEVTGLTLVPEPAVSSAGAAGKASKRNAARQVAARDREVAANAKLEARRQANRRLHEQALTQAGGVAADVARAEERVRKLKADLETAQRELRVAQRRSAKALDEAARLAARLDD